jgi:D-glycero-D-manno-heptose 1,7-bisphosphate phosphatase
MERKRKRMRKVLFLDRDGVINCVVRNEKGEYDSPQTVEQVSLVNGIENLISWANINGIKVVEITNQPAVAKGKMTMEISDEIEEKIDSLLKDKKVRIDKKYICYHHPKGIVPEFAFECECRKPKPGLLIRAAEELDIDLSNSVFLGDRDWDVLAGKAAGCKTILYLFEEDSPEKIKFAMESTPDYKVWGLDEALVIIKSLFKKN